MNTFTGRLCRSAVLFALCVAAAGVLSCGGNFTDPGMDDMPGRNRNFPLGGGDGAGDTNSDGPASGGEDGTGGTEGGGTVPVTGVTLDRETLTLAIGKTKTLTATVSPDDAADKTVTWESGNERVAAVSNTGLVTAVAEGYAKITVTTTDGGFKDFCKVTVVPENTGAIITEAAITGKAEVGRTLTATATDSNGDVVTDAAFRWKRADSGSGLYSDISGATDETYTLAETDKDKYIRVEADNEATSDPGILSEATGPVAAAPGQSAKPEVISDRVKKTAITEETVTFTLTTALQGDWRVYSHAGNRTHPDGVSVTVTGTALSLSRDGGIPHGDYWVTVTEPDKTESPRLALTVVLDAETPVITVHPQDTKYEICGSVRTLGVTASVSDGGTLSYKWYRITGSAAADGRFSGTESSYALAATEIAYYYVTVTNTSNSANGEKTASVKSNTAAVCVRVGLEYLEAYLTGLPQNTETAPHTVILSPSVTIDTSDESESGAWATINRLTKTAGRYVTLDLSACTARDGDTPNSISGDISISTHLLVNQMNAITSNKYIKGIVLPDTLTNIGKAAFGNCNYLTSVTIPAGVTVIGNYAFDCCTKLTGVIIPAGVTGIGNDAFGNCWNLTGVTIPGSVTSIGTGAFAKCRSLTSVTFAAGSNIAETKFGNVAFPPESSDSSYTYTGSNYLKNAYAKGGAGTYTRASGGDVWTKQN